MSSQPPFGQAHGPQPRGTLSLGPFPYGGGAGGQSLEGGPLQQSSHGAATGVNSGAAVDAANGFPGNEVDHTRFLSEDIGGLHLGEEYSDVTLVVEGHRFRAHRVILAARSRYFRALLYGGMRESRSPEVELFGTPLSAFKTLLKYIYTGRMRLPLGADGRGQGCFVRAKVAGDNFPDSGGGGSEPPSSLPQLLGAGSGTRGRIGTNNAAGSESGAALKAEEAAEENEEDEDNEAVVLDVLGLAHQYGFDDLEAAVSAHLQRSLSIRNVCLIFDAATLYGLGELTGACCDFIDRNAAEVVRHESLTQLSGHSFRAVISRDSFCAQEVDIFRAVHDWMKANPALHDRAEETAGILAEVRLSLMSTKDLLSVVRPTGLVPPDTMLDAIQARTQSRDMELRYRGHLIPEVNLATPQHGAEVVAGEGKSALLDGETKNFDAERGFTRHTIDENDERGIVVRLGVPSIINHLRVLLWDKDGRAYSYYVEVSMDEKDWVRVADYTKYHCRSWQELFFVPRVVRYIKIVGTYNNVNRSFHVVSLEAFYKNTHFDLDQHAIIIPNENVATIQKNALVKEGVCRSRNALLNGDVNNYNWDSGYTCHQLGSGSIVVQLAQPFAVDSMRLLLWDCDDRCYSYYVEVSNNDKDWEVVCDRSRMACRSWQTITFPRRPIVYIRIVGTHNTANEVFHCVHFECPSVPLLQAQAQQATTAQAPAAVPAVAHSLPEGDPQPDGYEEAEDEADNDQEHSMAPAVSEASPPRLPLLGDGGDEAPSSFMALAEALSNQAAVENLVVAGQGDGMETQSQQSVHSSPASYSGSVPGGSWAVATASKAAAASASGGGLLDRATTEAGHVAGRSSGGGGGNLPVGASACSMARHQHLQDQQQGQSGSDPPTGPSSSTTTTLLRRDSSFLSAGSSSASSSSSSLSLGAASSSRPRSAAVQQEDDSHSKRLQLQQQQHLNGLPPSSNRSQPGGVYGSSGFHQSPFLLPDPPLPSRVVAVSRPRHVVSDVEVAAVPARPQNAPASGQNGEEADDGQPVSWQHAGPRTGSR